MITEVIRWLKVHGFCPAKEEDAEEAAVDEIYEIVVIPCASEEMFDESNRLMDLLDGCRLLEHASIEAVWNPETADVAHIELCGLNDDLFLEAFRDKVVADE